MDQVRMWPNTVKDQQRDGDVVANNKVDQSLVRAKQRQVGATKTKRKKKREEARSGG